MIRSDRVAEVAEEVPGKRRVVVIAEILPDHGALRHE